MDIFCGHKLTIARRGVELDHLPAVALVNN